MFPLPVRCCSLARAVQNTEKKRGQKEQENRQELQLYNSSYRFVQHDRNVFGKIHTATHLSCCGV